MNGSKLVVISGPIASGKSSVAESLAKHVRGIGLAAAVVDLDRVYSMLDHGPLMADHAISRQARRAAAALMDHFVLEDCSLVIVEGTFWTRSERDEFVQHLTTPVIPRFVTLRVSVDEALRRVELDPRRGASRYPEVLRSSHAAFAVAPPIDGDVVIDSTALTIHEVTSMIGYSLENDAETSTEGPLIRDIDCLQVPVPDIAAALEFYSNALGHTIVWRTATAAGLQLGDSRTELVLQTERPELETNLSVRDVDAAARTFVDSGGTLVVAPFDIAIGRCAVVRDPWGNRLVLLDHSRGRLLTDTSRRVRTKHDR